MTGTSAGENSEGVAVMAARGTEWSLAAQATLMTLLAGFVDAVGYSALGHLYLSFMSGNSTQLGMAIAHRDAQVIVWAGAVIAAFVLGAFVGSLLNAAGPRTRVPPVLAAELGCLLGAWTLNGPLATNAALLLVALAMGMQNAIHRSIAGAATGKSFVTGALFGLGDALARVCLGTARPAEAGAYALSWLAFIAGVSCGAVAFATLGIGPALLGAAAILLALMALSWWRPSRAEAGA